MTPFGYLGRHWRGQLPLPVSYWVNGVLLSIALVISAFEVAVHFPSARGIAASILGAFAVFSLAGSWQAVGTWRSVRRYVSNDGSVIWAALAKLTCIVCSLSYVVISLAEIPTLRESFRVVSYQDRTIPSRIRVLNNGRDVEISGGISPGTADALRNVLDKTTTIRLVQLNNHGGRIEEGVRLGELIDAKGLATFTARECVSACILAFMGGKERYLGAKGRLGFHEASYFGGGGDMARAGTERERQVLLWKGLAEAFVDKALSTPASSMWFPTTSELLEARVVTAVVDEGDYANAGISGWRDSAALEAAFASVPLIAVLKRADPATYRILTNAFVSSIQDGMPAHEMNAKVGNLLAAAILVKYVPHGPDQELGSYYRAETRALRDLQAISPVACAAKVYPEIITAVAPDANGASRGVSPEILEEEKRALRTLIDASLTHPAAIPSAESVQADLEAVSARVERRFPGALDLLDHPERARGQPERLCDASLEFLDTVLTLPPQKSGPLLRLFAAATTEGQQAPGGSQKGTERGPRPSAMVRHLESP
jgi:hypothetical protein